MGEGRDGRYDAWVALSLANLCLLDVWAALLPAAISPANAYLLAGPPAPVQHAVALALLAALTLGILPIVRGLRSRRRSRAWAARAAFLGLLAVAANALRLQLPGASLDALRALPAAGLALPVALAVCVASRARWRPDLERATRALAVLAPLAVLCSLQSLAAALTSQPHPTSMPAAAALPSVAAAPPAAGPRVVLVLYDELDYRVAFEARPAGIELPALDALRAASLDARDAHPPGAWTAISVPGLLIGERMQAVERRGPARLELRLPGRAEPLSFAAADTVFSRVAAAGRRVGVVGWYHPYCRLFEATLAQCRSQPAAPFTLPATRASAALREQLELLAFTAPGVFRFAGGRRAEARYHLASFRSLQREAERTIGDASLDFVYLHLPVPHTPGIWDAPGGRFRVAGGSYAENLALADASFARLDAQLAASGLAPRSWVLVTSDHHWRASGSPDRRVPFLLRPPSGAGAAGLALPGRLETRHAAALVPKLLSGELASLEAVAHWLDERAGRLVAQATPR